MAAGRPLTDPIGEQLVGWGKAARIETRGRRSGQTRPVAVGFVEEPDGSILVAAGDSAHWGLNLLADPGCRVTVGGRTFDAYAEVLEGDDVARVVRELILRYGTPSEGLGAGPAFRLRPVA